MCGVYDSIRGGPLEIRGGWVKIFQWMHFSFSANCLHEFFFDVKALHDFFFDSTFSYHTLVQFTCRNFLLKGELLAGIFFGNCHPPPPSVISNAPPLSHK